MSSQSRVDDFLYVIGGKLCLFSFSIYLAKTILDREMFVGFVNMADGAHVDRVVTDFFLSLVCKNTGYRNLSF